MAERDSNIKCAGRAADGTRGANRRAGRAARVEGGAADELNEPRAKLSRARAARLGQGAAQLGRAAGGALRPRSAAAARARCRTWPLLHTELRRPGVTLALLHMEYLEKHPDGSRYTAFCARSQRVVRAAKPCVATDARRGRQVVRRLLARGGTWSIPARVRCTRSSCSCPCLARAT
jgi:hypothetical protein